ncbi:hypothetical protein [Kitasatospora sp. NPDC057198]|uniref:hypothetical protein n=1 Tax=Kitasatospora sp. NPDC057198 TaxID=3346046 RepID=UPI0036310B67
MPTPPTQADRLAARQREIEADLEVARQRAEDREEALAEYRKQCEEGAAAVGAIVQARREARRNP